MLTRTRRKTITFHLRKNVKWHDGVPFTAEDCLFTYQKLIDPNVAASGVTTADLVEQYQHVLAVRATDDHFNRATVAVEEKP